MASRTVSPGGALLRASRVFSIPSPLPRPPPDLSSSVVFNSETATFPHPTHLSITTPASSLAKGDWGFKRPLPLRSTTRTSTPIIRVKAIDTWEHITDFGSSADHALTLAKWLEMGIPLTTPAVHKRDRNYGDDVGRSVFEDDIDQTAFDDSSKTDVRWKFKGPWLAGQTDGEFRKYLATEVRKRKIEFNQLLRTACANALTASHSRNDPSGVDEKPPPVQVSDITPAQLRDYTKSLRTSGTGRTDLYRLIRNFLDLPPAPSPPLHESIFGEVNNPRGQSIEVMPLSTSPYAQTGPPKTHPSAGLSYSRSSAHTFNHPVFGPQAFQPPVPARVVMPKNAATGAFPAVLGVGGFVTDVPKGYDSFQAGRKKGASLTIPGIESVEPNKVGGSKAYVNPVQARINTEGKVVLTVTGADPVAVAVLEGTTDNIPQLEETLSVYGSPTTTRSTGFSGRVNTRGREAYGLSRDNEEWVRSRDRRVNELRRAVESTGSKGR